MLYRRAPARSLVELYVRVGRIRVLSSPKTIEIAEWVARTIVDTYLEQQDLSRTAGDGEQRVNRSAT
jgi:hypothetical protein